MSKGKNYGTEGIHFVDSMTGAEIVQLTSSPSTSSNLYFENVNFTQDSKSVIFVSKRHGGRDAPNDLYRCDLDGRNLIQLTERDSAAGQCLSLDGTSAYFSDGNTVCSVDMESVEETTLATFDDAASVGNLSAGGEWIFGTATYADGTTAVVRCDSSGGGETVLRKGKKTGHINASRTGNWIAWIETAEINEYDTQTWYVMRSDGSDNRRWAIQNWAHSAWIGETDRMQGPLLPPEHAIAACSPEDESEIDAQRIASGPYFWHSGASMDGEWIVSDTNWPDVGLQLIHVPSGRFSTLCLSQATNSNHPAHPHPSFSPDGKKVLYNSDRTGINQVYIATIPEWLIDELSTGKLLARYKVGPRMA
jgi:oligogalacturonide lyase